MPPATGDDLALGVVDLSIISHLEHSGSPESAMAEAHE